MAGRHVLETNPVGASMEAIAKAAGVSRQALYLHFGDRATLIVEISRLLDGSERTAAKQRAIDDAPTAREALREAVALQAYLKPRLAALARAMDVLSETDEGAAAALDEREQARRERCKQVIRRLHAEGDLRAEHSITTATDLMWMATSQRSWRDLVTYAGWSTQRYRTYVTRMLELALLESP